jgi:hypothetical protein
MARTWLQVRVELESGRDIVCDPRPGRVFIVGPMHSFARLASAIDAAFARWDLGHLHGFELSDGRRVGISDLDWDPPWLDYRKFKVVREVKPGDSFAYTFDFGDDWRHACSVLAEKVDPLEVYGGTPLQPIAIEGWGWIPDQYGRRSEDGAA